jgi:hypothetical protein
VRGERSICGNAGIDAISVNMDVIDRTRRLVDVAR